MTQPAADRGPRLFDPGLLLSIVLLLGSGVFSGFLADAASVWHIATRFQSGGKDTLKFWGLMLLCFWVLFAPGVVWPHERPWPWRLCPYLAGFGIWLLAASFGAGPVTNPSWGMRGWTLGFFILMMWVVRKRWG